MLCPLERQYNQSNYKLLSFFCVCVCVFLDTQLCLFDVLSLHEHFLNGPLPLELQRAMERAVMPGPPSAPRPAVGAEADAGGAKL